MSVEAIIAIVAFVALFLGWVVVPSIIKKHHEAASEDSAES